MTTHPRVTVAGAGVLGLTTALALADAGCAVTVADPGGPNASSVAAGMIAPVFEAVLDPAARDHFDLLLAARDLWPALAHRTGVALDRSGALAVGGETWMAQVAQGFAGLNERPAEIGGRTAQALAPGLGETFGSALFTREDWRVEASAALEALRMAARAAGVVFLPKALAGGQEADRGESDVLVVATGAGGGLAAVAPEIATLSPIKGHIVRLAGAATGAVVRGEGVYVAPGDVRVLGATMEPGRDDPAIDEARAAPLLTAGLRLFPDLAGRPYRISVGVRAATPDGLPMAGPGKTPGVMLATGARRNGWLLAPLVAQVVTARVTGRDPGPYATRLDPARFG
ncbi:FAD-dependent oxidoreductase [Phenylobacterium sp.]|uniref:NAD(P)/FAD-dependent oxidoreductase n=1 Tax=Phenylobacterium sp. TaxID=1871053 RepID=UPI00301DD16D